VGLAGFLALGILVTGCGSSLIGPASTTPTSVPAGAAPTTTVPLAGEVAVAFPVVACTNSFGGPLSGQGWKPTILLAPIPTALVGQVEFYSDGVHTVLGPSGWNCAQTLSNQGATGLVVYPAGVPNPPVGGTPAAGTQGVFATFDTTGHVQGITLVCPFFTIPKWQQTEANCTGAKPVGEQSSMPTPDVASVTDPAGVAGSLAGSGGAQAVTGAVIFPQAPAAVTYGTSTAVAVESCSLTDLSLCPTILSDFEVREFPVPTSTVR
jgi:hypothetical protein